MSGHFAIYRDEDGTVTTEIAFGFDESGREGFPIRNVVTAGRRDQCVIVPLKRLKEMIAAVETAKEILKATGGPYSPSRPVFGHRGDEPESRYMHPAQVNGVKMADA